MSLVVAIRNLRLYPRIKYVTGMQQQNTRWIRGELRPFFPENREKTGNLMRKEANAA